MAWQRQALHWALVYQEVLGARRPAASLRSKSERAGVACLPQPGDESPLETHGLPEMEGCEMPVLAAFTSVGFEISLLT